MNLDPEPLAEMLNLIVDQLLLDNTFCGSAQGRRIRELRRTLTGGPVTTTRPLAERTARRELISSTLVLPLDLDTALSAASEQSGVPRNALIEGAVALMIAEKRLI